MQTLLNYFKKGAGYLWRSHFRSILINSSVLKIYPGGTHNDLIFLNEQKVRLDPISFDGSSTLLTFHFSLCSPF